MHIKKYKIKYTPSEEREFLIYGDKEMPKEAVEISFIEDIDSLEKLEQNGNLEIFSFRDFMTLLFPNRQRTRDKILSEAGIRTYADLSAYYYLIRTKQSHLSKRERDLVVEKYSEIVNIL